MNSILRLKLGDHCGACFGSYRSTCALRHSFIAQTSSLQCLPTFTSNLARHQASPSAPPNARSCVHDPVSDSVAHKSRKRREIELAHDGRAMRFNGLETEVEELCHLFVRVSFGDQLDNWRSRGVSTPYRWCSLLNALRSASETSDEKNGLWAASDSWLRGVAARIRLEQVAPRAGSEQLSTACVIVMHGEDQNFRLGSRHEFGGSPRRRSQAAVSSRAQRCRVSLLWLCRSRPCHCGFRDDFTIRLRFQECCVALTDDAWSSAMRIRIMATWCFAPVLSLVAD